MAKKANLLRDIRPRVPNANAKDAAEPDSQGASGYASSVSPEQLQSFIDRTKAANRDTADPADDGYDWLK